MPSTLGALLAIVAATFVSEDLTTIGVGLAARDGVVPLVPALAACTLGIYIGDVALWALGRYGGRRILAWRPLARLPTGSLRELARWMDRHPAVAILGSRFLPGTRVPLYVAAGMWGEHPWRFFKWIAVAVGLWTPLVVLATMAAGPVAVRPLEAVLGHGWWTRVVLAVSVFALLRAIGLAASATARRRVSDRLARLRRWEFWPAWMVNAPVAVWIACLALRHRSLTLFTAANPGIADGGIVGESKSAILERLPAAWVLPWTVIEPGPLDARMDAVRHAFRTRRWSYPVVAKPDVGERGTGVRWLQNEEGARRYLAADAGRVLLQAAHEGPFEAGVFYVRHPDEVRGRIVSITDKRFPAIEGDGRSTLEALVLAHSRYRLQSTVFLARHASKRQRVLAPGERFQLARAGNHVQGTEFLDGSWLWTPALEARIDAIARTFDGFYFGRFDLRYRDRDAFRAGSDLAIVELNGVTSEATHIYDPSWSLLAAWRTLMRQWSLAFAIGAANRARGHRPATFRRVAFLVWTFMRARPAHPVAD